MSMKKNPARAIRKDRQQLYTRDLPKKMRKFFKANIRDPRLIASMRESGLSIGRKKCGSNSIITVKFHDCNPNHALKTLKKTLKAYYESISM